MNREYGLAEQFAIAAADVPARGMYGLSRSYLEIYVVGAAIMELIMKDRLSVDPKGYLLVMDNESTGQSDSCSIQLEELIRNARKPKKLKGWIIYFYSYVKSRRAMFGPLTESLFDEEALTIKKKKFLYIFPYRRYITTSEHKECIIRRLRAELLAEGPVSKETAVLAMLLETSKQLKRYFSRYEHAELKRAIAELHESQSEEWKHVLMMRRAMEEMESSYG
ncbi:GPP34 family phosphoprotein [Paenibacillus sp. BC26]|uniref:GOLPH3/VPS74 family protein n=1 Tax=Paenibacillus sp. BC26 TaxID=1881032 RepID=UPI0008DEB100|nr:GPP34 family phosphoprotein [Paenibacillus sp. BC26]SFS56849.1 Golgi phosphoprotein 3 (GPP34) [Paenibacillus sp. BC26]